MQEITIQEGVLNDDIVYITPEGKVFKGQYVAILEYFTYATEWSNRRHFRRFKTIDALTDYIDKHYPEYTSECLFQEVIA